MSDETTLTSHIRRQALRDSKQLVAPFLNFLLPPTCGMCRTIIHEQGALCSTCWQKLNFISAPYCQCCGKPFSTTLKSEKNQHCTHCLTQSPPFTMARAALVYNGPSRLLVTRFKYKDQTQLLPTLLPWMERAGHDLKDNLDLIIPVPMHRWRLWRRTFNQAALLAQALSKSFSCPISWTGLKRTRHTRPQVGMTAKERSRNVKNVFAANPDKIKNKCILLVDDVYTTGATLRACTRELLKQGASEVRVLTLARVVHDSNN